MRAAVDRFAGPLTRYAMTITGNLESAQDVVQDTFVKLCAEDRSKVDSRLAPWLFTVCRNRAWDVQRKLKRMDPLSETEMRAQASEAPSPALVAERRETAGHVLQLMARLPQKQQEVVRLKFQNDLSYQEISEVTHLSVSHVGVLIHTALKMLRQQMQKEQGAAAEPFKTPRYDNR